MKIERDSVEEKIREWKCTTCKLNKFNESCLLKKKMYKHLTKNIKCLLSVNWDNYSN